jgi:hypothetical protein
MRVDAAMKERLQTIANRMTMRLHSHVTLTTVVMQAVGYGIEMVEREASGFMLPKSKRMTDSERLLAVAEEAFKIGIEQLQAMSLGNHVSDLSEPE